jgi:hypothetical protein
VRLAPQHRFQWLGATEVVALGEVDPLPAKELDERERAEARPEVVDRQSAAEPAAA